MLAGDGVMPRRAQDALASASDSTQPHQIVDMATPAGSEASDSAKSFADCDNCRTMHRLDRPMRRSHCSRAADLPERLITCHSSKVALLTYWSGSMYSIERM